ncbi:hypothetical protein [Aureimonas sp. AU20]|uniref:hypothetical protein n=1 Tax=Aureimonas sp. AU20 TaxID=1349819 RepID=UPI0007207828|nr:hypothetical protein [Aureimonas sp. AU20]ALN71859.1 hypothetical protein M673_03975 [Aureimonas sp. AU20]
MIEHEEDGIKVNLVWPEFTNTALNNQLGTATLEKGSSEVVRVARFGPTDPSGVYTCWENQTISLVTDRPKGCHPVRPPEQSGSVSPFRMVQSVVREFPFHKPLEA